MPGMPGMPSAPDAMSTPDGQPAEDPQPEEQPTEQLTPDQPPVPGAAPVQDTALNGAQVTSLASVLDSVSCGKMSKETAKFFIRAAFPSISDKAINGMVDNTDVKELTQPTPKPTQEPVEYSEVDDLTTQIESAGASAMEKLLEPIRRLVNNAQSLEEIRDGLLDAYPEMNVAEMAEVLTDAMAAAHEMGRASVRRSVK